MEQTKTILIAVSLAVLLFEPGSASAKTKTPGKKENTFQAPGLLFSITEERPTVTEDGTLLVPKSDILKVYATRPSPHGFPDLRFLPPGPYDLRQLQKLGFTQIVGNGYFAPIDLNSRSPDAAVEDTKPAAPSDLDDQAVDSQTESLEGDRK